MVCEGTLALHYPEIRQQADLKIYLDVPADICLVRRLVRDQRERGRTVEQITSQYLSTVQPMFEQFVEPSRIFADLVVHHPRELVKKLTKLLSILSPL
jgi:uridine kinase